MPFIWPARHPFPPSPSVHMAWGNFSTPSFSRGLWFRPKPTHGPGPWPEIVFLPGVGTSPHLGQWGLHCGVLCKWWHALGSAAGDHLATEREELAQEWGWQDGQQSRELRRRHLSPHVWGWASGSMQARSLSTPALFIIRRGSIRSWRSTGLLGFKLRLYYILCDLGHVT